MAKLRGIKDRIESISKIKKITNAMQIVALTRVRRMEQATLDARFYFDKIRELLFGIKAYTNFNMHTLLAEREQAQPIGIVAVGSDKGLCGNFNANIIQRLKGLRESNSGAAIKIAAAGRKIIKYVESRRGDFEILNTHSPLNTDSVADIADKVSKIFIEDFIKLKINSVYLLYNQFKLYVTGQVKEIKILPLVLEEPKKALPHQRNYIYEPEPREIFDSLLREYIKNQIHHALLESVTAEEMARMLSMKTATENAQEMIARLTIDYHKARQKAITSELMDIIGAAEAAI